MAEHGQGESPRRAYLDYLDREIAHVGFLPPFAVAIAALALKTIGEASGDTLFGRAATHWPTLTLILVGTVLTLAAAGFFWQQRGHLAWHYGKAARPVAPGPGESPPDFAWAQTTAAWRPYRRGFALLIGGVAAYTLALARAAAY